MALSGPLSVNGLPSVDGCFLPRLGHCGMQDSSLRHYSLFELHVLCILSVVALENSQMMCFLLTSKLLFL